jgi:hypothetical protein
MTHPHRLHAAAAAWSLHTARLALAAHAEREATHNATSLLDAAGVLHSPVWGGRHASGDHGDPTGALLLAPVRTRDTRWADLVDRLDRRLTWIADQVRPSTGLDPIVRILAAVQTAQPGTAAGIARHLADEDAWIRIALVLPPGRQLIPGVDCPACQVRQLYVQTAAPVDAQTVICSAGCLCTGDGCPCGMAVQVVGVAHIWPRAAVMGAVAGAAPTQAA